MEKGSFIAFDFYNTQEPPHGVHKTTKDGKNMVVHVKGR